MHELSLDVAFTLPFTPIACGEHIYAAVSSSRKSLKAAIGAA
jgi:hypothetical protein